MPEEVLPNHEIIQSSRFDRDIEMIETLGDPLDRGRFALDLFREATGDQASALYRGERSARRLPVEVNWGCHYTLPDIQGAHWGSVAAIESEQTFAGVTPEHVFVPVAQETMWRVELARGPYLYASMSECSTLVGWTDDELWMAHIGFSRV